MAKRNLRGGAETSERIANPVGDGGGHLADRCELLGLDQLRLRRLELRDFALELGVESRGAGLRLLEALRHLREGAREVADLVRRADVDRELDFACADARHGHAQLTDRAREPARDEPRGEEPGADGEGEDRDQRVALAGDDLLEARVRAAHARLARLAIDVAIELRERGEELIAEIALRHVIRCLALPRVVERKDAVRDELDAALNLLGAVRELRLIGPELRSPALLPILDDDAGCAEFIACVRVEPAEIAPDDLTLVEHRRLELGIRARAGHVLAEQLEGITLEDVRANRLDPDEQRGEDHEREAEQHLALKGHLGECARRGEGGGGVRRGRGALCPRLKLSRERGRGENGRGGGASARPQ